MELSCFLPFCRHSGGKYIDLDLYPPAKRFFLSRPSKFIVATKWSHDLGDCGIELKERLGWSRGNFEFTQFQHLSTQSITFKRSFGRSGMMERSSFCSKCFLWARSRRNPRWNLWGPLSYLVFQGLTHLSASQRSALSCALQPRGSLVLSLYRRGWLFQCQNSQSGSVSCLGSKSWRFETKASFLRAGFNRYCQEDRELPWGYCLRCEFHSPRPKSPCSFSASSRASCLFPSDLTLAPCFLTVASSFPLGGVVWGGLGPSWRSRFERCGTPQSASSRVQKALSSSSSLIWELGPVSVGWPKRLCCSHLLELINRLEKS